MMCVPAATDGMTKFTLLITPPASLVTGGWLRVKGLPSIVKVIVWFPEKPFPLINTLAPNTPETGVSVTFGPNENVATALPPLSEAFTVWLPWIPEGIIMLQLKPPRASQLTADGEVCMLTLSTVIKTLLSEPAPKPVPFRVIVSPTPPETGFRTILELTEND